MHTAVPQPPPLLVHDLPVSAAFKKEAFRSVLSIAAFAAVYLLLIAASLGLVYVCLYIAFALVMNMGGFYSILFGLGIAGIGIMVVVFLIKFLFAQNKVDHSDAIEITAAEQPRLVAFIHDLAHATHTSKPKRIFLSPDVNACVFYNSSFWSLFLPVRKNLKIGLGLVNAVNESELQAVIAHEFGHFSQRSMKVGSYVYHVNHIIYNMLYQNNDYGSTLQAWGKANWVFGFSASATVEILKIIQWVLRHMYAFVNKNYMALSRQMEFHADHVAASVSGSNNILSALRRIEFADYCYQITLTHCDTLIKEKKVVEDVFGCHKAVLLNLAALNDLEVINGLPLVTQQEARVGPRVNFKNQWASHPTLEEREAYLLPWALTASTLPDPAWKLFEGTEALKQQCTQLLYRHVAADLQQQRIPTEDFCTYYTTQFQTAVLPEVYKGYYDNRQIALFSIEECLSQPLPQKSVIQLSDEQVALPRKIHFLENDIALLSAIAQKEVATKTFDFDGQKYSSKEATTIQETLQAELQKEQATLAALDQELFCNSYHHAPSAAEATAIKELYQHYFALRTSADHYLHVLESLMQPLQPIFGGQTLEFDHIHVLIHGLKEKGEPLFKAGLQEWLAAGAFDGNAEMVEKIKNFILADYQYFHDNRFFETELGQLHELVTGSWECVQQYLYLEFKKVLEYQAMLLTQKQAVHMASI
jgi:Zn-dependent protease with chaperone function